MKRCLLLLSIIMCVVFNGCEVVVKKESLQVTATVTELEYRNAYHTMIPVRNVNFTSFITQYHSEQNLVTITYENISKTFNDKELYEKVKEGDQIQVTLLNGYDKEDNLVYQELYLLDE